MNLNRLNLKLVGTDRRTVRPNVLPSVAPAVRPYPQKGVALIITLILLAVVTVMAITFLAVSRRERGAVSTTTDTANARLAADAALAQAEAQIMANILSTTNPYNFGLIVSTNYINPAGYNPTVGSNLTNVNYAYANGNSLDANDLEQNIANLLYSPRVPVFVQTNFSTASRQPSSPLDFRFYLDLNRNGVDDANGWVTNVVNQRSHITTASLEVGDPEWIGGLERPDVPHGSNNPFLYRYAFTAVPIGNALDLNAIYNQARTKEVNPASGGIDGFMRNEGVGSWEINLAAFLADLNTNEWDNSLNQPYNYFEPGSANTGLAFEDALSLLSYRYAYNYANLPSVSSLFARWPVFELDNIDGYSDGPLMTGFQLPGDSTIPPLNDNPALPWAGADNTNHFFDMQDLFDTNKTAIGITGNNFTTRLLAASEDTNSTYDRYTFYRLLSQMGVDSAPEQNKLNLNYSNAVAYYTNGVLMDSAVIPNAETNFVQWTPINFFTLAADRMLRAYSQEWLASNPSNYVASYNVTNAFSITNIPVLVSNRLVYSSAINRVLQLAANIYDATTNNSFNGSLDWPDVFRPTFWVTNEFGYKNVYINGYEQVASVLLPNDEQPGGRLSQPTNATDLPFGFNANVNVYGVPWIIGAKKYLPNFNEFSLESIVGITRRLQVTRPATNSATSVNFAAFHTNQMYTMVITNALGVECWNSYASNYFGNNVQIVVRDNLLMTLTNDDGMTVVTNDFVINNAVNPTNWTGTAPWPTNGPPNPGSFAKPFPLNVSIAVPLNPAYLALTNWWAYRFDTRNFLPIPPAPNLFETDVPGFPFPHFGLMTTNRLQVFMLDFTNGVYHVIDYAQFAGPDSSRDLNAEISFVDNNDPNHAGVWDTNLSIASSTLGVPYGILNQIQISRASTKFPSGPSSEDGTWHGDPEATPLGGTPPQQQAFFDGIFKPGNVGSAPSWGGYSGVIATNLELTNQAPYSPTRYVVLYTTWQANDPLVHYLASDLNYTRETGTLHPGTNTFNYGATNLIPILPNLGQLNDHYTPWGGNPNYPPNPNTPDDPNTANAHNPAIKDPLMINSDDWDFPTNKLPTVGWLGRVHRGTPWQTVYLKSSDVLDETSASSGANIGINTWAQWTGDTQLTFSQYFDAENSAPAQDRLLFDLFSTAFDDNATRGQLSVNVGANDPNNPQAGLAAWSAVFSGVIVPTNATGGYTVIQPVGTTGTNSPLYQIVNGINQTRTNFQNADGLTGTFEHSGDILAVPQLTDQSPFFNGLDRTNGINDAMYEWIPQQTMSLLRVADSPRYVIYSYGQALKPAPNGIVTSGGFFGMITNYQVVSETATRTVVRFNSQRIDNVFQTNVFGSLIWTNVPSVTNNNAVIESFNVLPPD
jgi:hypothetical protein